VELFTYKNTDPAAGSGRAGLPLSGKRVVIQPNISRRGWPCHAGSRALENFVALEDSTVLARLMQAGAHLAGNSRMSELGFGLSGDTTIQILVEKKADIALMTDTMGDARAAAAGAGMFGFKPSWGVVSRFGLIGLVPSMECCGVAAEDIQDIIGVMKAIAGKDERDFSMPDEESPDFSAVGKSPAGACRAGVIREMLSLLADEDRGLFRENLEKLENAGVEITEVSFPEFDLFRTAHQVIAAVEASSSAGKYDGVRYGYRSPGAKNWNDMYLNSRGESFGTLIKGFLFQGAYFQFENYAAFENAGRIRRRLVRDMANLFREIDVLVSPTRRIAKKEAAASDVRGVYDAFLLTLPANLTGQPALQIPGQAPAGKDTGVQLTALRLDDARLLALGERLTFSQEAA
jgi:aspartyl-tRNA(Asn)/glutamyl-tRNA(Gln) amidotransferase subunit A